MIIFQCFGVITEKVPDILRWRFQTWMLFLIPSNSVFNFILWLAQSFTHFQVFNYSTSNFYFSPRHIVRSCSSYARKAVRTLFSNNILLSLMLNMKTIISNCCTIAIIVTLIFNFANIDIDSHVFVVAFIPSITLLYISNIVASRSLLRKVYNKCEQLILNII
jgi:hypothetical protein